MDPTLTTDERLPSLHFRLSPRLKALVEQVAEREHRCRSAQVRRYIIEGLRRDGMLETDTSREV